MVNISIQQSREVPGRVQVCVKSGDQQALDALIPKVNRVYGRLLMDRVEQSAVEQSGKEYCVIYTFTGDDAKGRALDFAAKLESSISKGKPSEEPDELEDEFVEVQEDEVRDLEAVARGKVSDRQRELCALLIPGLNGQPGAKERVAAACRSIPGLEEFAVKIEKKGLSAGMCADLLEKLMAMPGGETALREVVSSSGIDLLYQAVDGMVS